MDSVPPAITQSAEPELILAQAKWIASKPEPQYLLITNPGTSFGNDSRDMYLAICIPCSASGTALPTIRSSTIFPSNPSVFSTSFLIMVAARSSGRTNLNPPFFALPTGDLKPETIYASFILIS